MRRKETTMSTEITTSESAQPKRKAKIPKTKPDKTAKRAGNTTKRAKTKSASKPKDGTKKDRVHELLRRKEGDTIAEIAKARDIQTDLSENVRRDAKIGVAELDAGLV